MSSSSFPQPTPAILGLVERGKGGDRRALARAITIVENRTSEASMLLKQLYPLTGRAHIIGITGAPGAGKSTLTNQLIKEFRKRNHSVGVIAIDPTSTLTGGAVLGDRIRMLENYNDKEVFIRSMATRGQLGGLASATSDVVRAMDAFGKEIIILETVGVGQDEVDIAKAAHTTILVEVPGMGDDIQAIKAGVLEIADLIVINKADRDGVERLQLHLRAMMSLTSKKREWEIPILKTIAAEGSGICELVDQAEAHLAYLKTSGEYGKREKLRMRDEMIARISEEILTRLLKSENAPGGLNELLERIEQHELDLYEAAIKLLDGALQ
jgi:LAO/AO transport system kinase